MNSYADVDGVPAAADRWLLTELLRDEWGFEGTVVSDYWAVPFLATMHRVAADADEAGVLALTAGIDVELPDTVGFGQQLVARVRRGELDEAAGRPGGASGAAAEGRARAARPGLDPRGLGRGRAGRTTSTAPPTGTSPAGWRRSRSCCSTPAPRCRSCSGRRRVRRCGGWRWSARARTTRARSWAATPSPTTCCRSTRTSTSARGQRAQRAGRRCAPSSPDVEVTHAAGLRRPGRRPFGLRRRGSPRPGTPTCASRSSATWPACSAAARPARAATPRTCGCPACRASCWTRCSPPARPSSSWWSRDARTPSARSPTGPPALVQAFMPGEEGGAALAGVLSGRVNPSGRLPVQVPRHPGAQPGTYLQPPLGVEHVRRQQPRPDAAVPVRPRPRRTRPSRSTTRRSAPPRSDRRRVHGVGARPQHRAPRGHRGRAALPARPVARVTRPVRAARRVRPGRPGARRVAPWSCSPCTPT